MLEVLQILEAEVNLREETRVTEQARPAVERKEYVGHANKLADTQGELGERIVKVIARILELKDARQNFGKELGLLTKVKEVMDETCDILAQPETGSPAIAAETEIIELLLAAKRIKPGSGGGGGSSPGGGGGGDTTTSALALVGSGTNDKQITAPRDVTQATGETGASYPEEYRSGLDEFFNRLDKDYALE